MSGIDLYAKELTSEERIAIFTAIHPGKEIWWKGTDCKAKVFASRGIQLDLSDCEVAVTTEAGMEWLNLSNFDVFRDEPVLTEKAQLALKEVIAAGEKRLRVDTVEIALDTLKHLAFSALMLGSVTEDRVMGLLKLDRLDVRGEFEEWRQENPGLEY